MECLRGISLLMGSGGKTSERPLVSLTPRAFQSRPGSMGGALFSCSQRSSCFVKHITDPVMRACKPWGEWLGGLCWLICPFPQPILIGLQECAWSLRCSNGKVSRFLALDQHPALRKDSGHHVWRKKPKNHLNE